MGGPVLPTHGRFDYVPITKRPDYSWPGGKRLALWVALNVETFGFGLEGPTLGNPLPDARPPQLVVARVRQPGRHLAHARDGRPVRDPARATRSTRTSTTPIPRSWRRWRKRRRDEIMGHGRTNSEEPGQRPEAEERALIAEATEAITADEGKAPAGWMTPLQAESEVTPIS